MSARQYAQDGVKFEVEVQEYLGDPCVSVSVRILNLDGQEPEHRWTDADKTFTLMIPPDSDRLSKKHVYSAEPDTRPAVSADDLRDAIG